MTVNVDSNIERHVGIVMNGDGPNAYFYYSAEIEWSAAVTEPKPNIRPKFG